MTWVERQLACEAKLNMGCQEHKGGGGGWSRLEMILIKRILIAVLVFAVAKLPIDCDSAGENAATIHDAGDDTTGHARSGGNCD